MGKVNMRDSWFALAEKWNNKFSAQILHKIRQKNRRNGTSGKNSATNGCGKIITGFVPVIL
jgi:hypothetical protein